MNISKVAELKGTNFSSILNDEENKSLLEQLQKFSQTLGRYGFNVSAYSEASLARLPQMSSDEKNKIRTFFMNWGSWIEPDGLGEGILEIDLDKEKYFLKRALDYYGLWLHEDFWKTLRHGQVIELYGENMVQLYRNIHFFQFCSYSLLDVSVFQWYHLWHRPSQIQQEMMADANKVLTVATPVIPYRVSRHVLRENKAAHSPENHSAIACLVQFKYIGSLFRGINPAPIGAIATSEAEVIGRGDEALQIQFV